MKISKGTIERAQCLFQEEIGYVTEKRRLEEENPFTEAFDNFGVSKLDSIKLNL